MSLLVMKFGGTSVANVDRIKRAAKRVALEVAHGKNVIVIVSAMSGKTNELADWVNDTSQFYDAREYDAVVSSGENVTAGLMALTLQEMDIPARSWQGWQVPVRTTSAHSSARIESISPQIINEKFAQGMKVAVVAGFQGISNEARITTLGRGGSDTTAVAFAAAFEAERCDIYTDVDGVYTTDPRVCDKAIKLDKISYEEMLEMASLGAKVMQPASIQEARLNRIEIDVKSTFSKKSGTTITKKRNITGKNIIRGISFTKNDAKLTLLGVKDKPGIAASIFKPLYENSINVDMVVQNISAGSKETDLTFTIKLEDLYKTRKLLENNKSINFRKLIVNKNVSKVSIVGVGMITTPGVSYSMFRALAKKKINIEVISTSEIKISVLINKKNLKKSVEILHQEFKLSSSL